MCIHLWSFTPNVYKHVHNKALECFTCLHIHVPAWCVAASLTANKVPSCWVGLALFRSFMTLLNVSRIWKQAVFYPPFPKIWSCNPKEGSFKLYLVQIVNKHLIWKHFMIWNFVMNGYIILKISGAPNSVWNIQVSSPVFIFGW